MCRKCSQSRDVEPLPIRGIVIFIAFVVAAVVGSLASGQSCGPKGCGLSDSFGPSYAWPAYVEPTYRPVQIAEPARVDATYAEPARVIARHRVQYHGGLITIEGWVSGPNRIDWDNTTPFNRKQVADFWAAVEASKATRPAPAPAPAPKGGRAVKDTASPMNYGIEPTKIGRRPNDHQYTADSAEAKRFVFETHAASDEDAKIHVTVIGSDADRAAVVKDMKDSPDLAGVRDKVMFQDYTPDEWPVDPKLGFVSGKPAIVIQAGASAADPKGGRVLWRSGDYSMGPKGLAEAIRKSDPHYRPDKDPGPANGGGNDPSSPASEGNLHWLAAAVAALALVFLLPNRKES